jgi:hypothetical protein
MIRPSDRPEPGANPITQRMALLRRMGFRQQKVYDDQYEVATVYFWRVWRGVRDAVLAYSDDECTAYRVWDEDFDDSHPFHVEPDLRIWGACGTFLDVTAELLSLPHPRAPGHFPAARS